MHLDYIALAIAFLFLCLRLIWPARMRSVISIEVAVLLLAICTFAAIAEDVATQDPLTLLDQHVETWFELHRSALLTTLMLGVTYLHGTIAVVSATFIAAVALWRRRERVWLETLIAASFGGMLLNVALKYGFHRARPIAALALGPGLTSYSFPSGHVDASTILYGFLCAFVFAHHTSKPIRRLVACISLLMVVSVAISRMYLGVHYLSDVAAAVAEGIAWLSLCLLVLRKQLVAEPLQV